MFYSLQISSLARLSINGTSLTGSIPQEVRTLHLTMTEHCNLILFVVDNVVRVSRCVIELAPTMGWMSIAQMSTARMIAVIRLTADALESVRRPDGPAQGGIGIRGSTSSTKIVAR
jgi:hypothetical protein